MYVTYIVSMETTIIQTYTTQTSLNFPDTFFSLAWQQCTALFWYDAFYFLTRHTARRIGKLTSNLYVTGCTTDLYGRGNVPYISAHRWPILRFGRIVPIFSLAEPEKSGNSDVP
jgi:hypothetical protein